MSLNHVREMRGLPAVDLLTVKKNVGHGLNTLLTRLCNVGDLAESAQWYLDHHPSAIPAGTTVLPGVIELLQSANQQGIGCGLCSNKPLAMSHLVLEVTGLAPYFGCVAGPESVPHRKPAPDMLHYAARQLNAAPADCLYLGDMTVDLEAGQLAGIETWLVLTGEQSQAELEAAGARNIFRDAAAVNEALFGNK